MTGFFHEGNARLRKIPKDEKYKVYSGAFPVKRPEGEKQSSRKNSEEYQTQAPAEENTSGKKF